MLMKILTPFRYAHDGLTVRLLDAGAHEHIRDELVDGLKASGWIDHVPVEPEAPVAETPRKGRGKAALAVQASDEP